MKLLFDLNLSTRLPQLLQDVYPGSRHVVDLNIAHLPDKDIWQFAAGNDFAIVSKDKDFYYLSSTFGGPPKVIWLMTGNCKNSTLVSLLLTRQNEITLFLKSGKDLLLLQ